MTSACLWSAGAFAADAMAPISVDAGEAMLRTGDVVSSETTGFSATLSADDLSQPGVTLPMLLGREAGTQIRQAGGLGSYSTATLRGSSTDQVMVYLDGVLLNDASLGGVNLSDIDLLQASQIDIYRGATPVQLNKASLGGAINIRTRSSDKPELRLGAGAGSWGTQQASLLGSGQWGGWSHLLTLGKQRSDNNFDYLNDNGTQYNRADDFEDQRRNAETDQNSLLYKLGREAGDAVDQDLSLQWFDKSQHLPDQRNSAANRARLDTGILRLQAAHRQNRVRGSAWNTRISAQASRSREDYKDLGSRIGLGAQSLQSTTQVLGLGNYWEHVSEQRSFALSADVRIERYDAHDKLGQVPDSEATRTELTLAVQESVYFNNQRWLLTPALRFQSVRDEMEVYTATDTDEVNKGSFSHQAWSPQMGVKYQLTPQLELLSNLGRYQRVPSFFELFGERGLFVGNDELTPETGTNFDIGFAARPEFAGMALSDVEVQLGVFYNDISDAITRVYDSRGIGKSQNISGAINRGLEWSLSARLAQHTRLAFTGTLQDTENGNSAPAFHGKQLPGQAQQTYSLELSQQLGPLRLAYDFQRRADSFYDTANLLPAADQSIHNLSLRYQLSACQLSLSLDNVTDEVYEDFNGYPKPGRTAFVSLTYSGAQSK